MRLEMLALQYLEQHGLNSVEGYPLSERNPASISTILEALISDIVDGRPTDLIAAKFHVTLVDIIASVAGMYPTRNLAFSGGVFQNSVLVDLVKQRLATTYRLHFHQQLKLGLWMVMHRVS